jgi:signal transduction histidine kinase
MSRARPVYLLAPPGSDSGLDGLFPGRATVRVARASALSDLAPGLLLLPLQTIEGDELLAALQVAAAGPVESGWLPVLVVDVAGQPRMLLPVSLGWATNPAELERWVEGAEDAQVLELRHVLTRVARARHDLNNPLTSAMAETQLVLLDARDPGLRSGLEAVEEQLRRIRDLVATLRIFRPPPG